MKSDRPLFSACMIVKDEEKHLARCLDSLQGLVDELVIVDTGSSDRTIEIANSYGAKLFHEEWQNDFSFHRNQALDRASGKWLFNIDADEEVVSTDIEDTRNHLENKSLPPILMIRELIVYPDGKQFEMFNPRIISAESGFRYVQPIHEQLDAIDAPAILSNIRVLHHGYLSQDGLEEKEKRNLSIAESLGETPHALHCIARSCMVLGDWEGMHKASSKLIQMKCGKEQAREACVLGGAAAFNLQNDEALDGFLEKGREIASDSPDIKYLELLSAARNYLISLQGCDSNSQGTFLRPWTFWHDAKQVKLLIQALVGEKQISNIREFDQTQSVEYGPGMEELLRSREPLGKEIEICDVEDKSEGETTSA